MTRAARRALAATALLGGLLALCLAAALWLAVEPSPRVAMTSSVSVDDIDRARQVLQRNDPRHALPGITRAVLLSQRDLELLIHQAGQRFGGLGGGVAGSMRARVRLQPGLAVVDASLRLPPQLWGGWLNLQAVLRETDALPTVQRLRIGRLPVPAWLAAAALPRLLGVLNLRAQGELAQRLVSRVGFRSQQLVLAYAWPDNPQQAITDSLLPVDEQARLRHHAEHLATLVADLPRQGAAGVSITQLLVPMFQAAAARSNDAASGALENRAALVALAFLAHGQRLVPLLAPVQAAGLLPAKRSAVRSAAPDLRLRGRPDFPQHLLVSAALAAEGGGPLADAIGLYKEVADARQGSGFSFQDLAADRAGTRLGLRARQDPQGLQQRLAAGVSEADLMPDVSDLPEYMHAAEFKRRFGGVGAPAYRAVLQDIEARLDKLPLLAAGR